MSCRGLRKCWALERKLKGEPSSEWRFWEAFGTRERARIASPSRVWMGPLSPRMYVYRVVLYRPDDLHRIRWIS